MRDIAGLPGTGNFDDDPHMIDPDGPDGEEGTDDDDLRIPHPALAGSPCVDAGDNDAIAGAHLQTDLDGEALEQHPYSHWTGTPLVDVGAYEVGPITLLHRAGPVDDLALRALVDGHIAHVSGSDAVELRAGDRLDLCIESPRGMHRGALAHLALDLLPAQPPIGMPRGILVGHSAMFLPAGMVPTLLGNGPPIPAGLVGVDLLAQGFVLDPQAPNGLVRVTDGRELRCR
ncbi:MAG: hypothetical protein IPM29_16290 [Planctomycetes bacterium]|nr:hypothetical protein [Planctomycetota bacterium]